MINKYKEWWGWWPTGLASSCTLFFVSDLPLYEITIVRSAFIARCTGIKVGANLSEFQVAFLKYFYFLSNCSLVVTEFCISTKLDLGTRYLRSSDDYENQ